MERNLTTVNLNTMLNSNEPKIKSVGELLKVALPEYLCLGDSCYSDGDIGIAYVPFNDKLMISVVAGIDTSASHEIAEITVKFNK